eukprot:3575800-Rhodomonas_salina.2
MSVAPQRIVRSVWRIAGRILRQADMALCMLLWYSPTVFCYGSSTARSRTLPVFGDGAVQNQVLRYLP